MKRDGLLYAAIATSIVVAACSSTSSSDTGDAAAPCTAYTTSIDLTTPTISFKTDVMAILQQSCAFKSCHGQGSGHLTMSTDPEATRTALVGVAATELPSMSFVTPGDPTNSFIMKKIDGDICVYKSQCVSDGTDPDCTDTMPQGNDLLDVPTRDTIRRWIAQGANDN